jgi:RimJ/RimL family protein N-acetyltransferase
VIAQPRLSVAGQVHALRTERLSGHVVDLLPYAPAYHARLIALRNDQRASYYLHQPEPLTIAGQSRWFEAYTQRADDLQWVIVSKDGSVVGGTALYNIADDRAQAEKGRLAVDDARAMEAPYALEAELLLLDLAFYRLELRRVLTCVRHNNTVMLSINAKLGFERIGQHDIRGVTYFDLALTAPRYAPHAWRTLAAAWARRAHRSAMAHT